MGALLQGCTETFSQKFAPKPPRANQANMITIGWRAEVRSSAWPQVLRGDSLVLQSPVTQGPTDDILVWSNLK